MNSTVCNNSSFCIDYDCQYYHNISLKDRKIVKNLYDKLVNPNKKEDNPDNRRRNCINGQICYNSKCSFRHRLVYTDRMKIVNGFNSAKLEMTKTEKNEKITKSYDYDIPIENAFECLELD